MGFLDVFKRRPQEQEGQRRQDLKAATPLQSTPLSDYNPFPGTSITTSIFDLPPARLVQKSMYDLAVDYASSVYVYRGVDYIAQACSGIRLDLYSDRERTKKIAAHPLLDLLDRPHEGLSGAELIKQLISFTVLAGNGYLYVVLAGGRPKSLWVLRPDLMDVQLDRSGNVQYTYLAGGQRQTIDPRNLLHIKMFNPIDDLLGLSPVAVAAFQVEQAKSGDTWNLALLQNSGRPSGALVAQAVLSDNSYLNLKRQIQETFSGARNAGRPIILEGGLDWKQFSLSPLELDWSQSKETLAREIALALGVPPILLGDTSSATYSNYAEARASFYNETILPLMDLLVSKLNTWLVPFYSGSLYLSYDKDDIEALQEDQGKLSERVNKQYELGYITANEARKATGYGELPAFSFIRTPDNKLLLLSDLPAYLQTTITPAAPPPLLLPAPQSDQEQEENNSVSDLKGGAGGTKEKRLLSALNLSYEEKAAYWWAFEAKRENWYSKVEKRVRAYFASEASKVTQAIEQAPTPGEAERYADQAIAGNIDALEALFATIYLPVGQDFGQSTYNAIEQRTRKKAEYKESSVEGNAPPFALDVWQQTALDWLRTKAGTKISGINNTTRQQVRDQLAKGVTAGDGIPELADRIWGLYKEYYDYRSETIARTETIAASNLGALAGAYQTGLPLKKEWISTRDNRTRDAHLKADGQTVGRDETFEVWGEQLEYPGSVGASGRNVINCRCTLGFVYDAEVEKPVEQQTQGEYTPQQSVQNGLDWLARKYPETTFQFDVKKMNLDTANELFKAIDTCFEQFPEVRKVLTWIGDGVSTKSTPESIKTVLRRYKRQKRYDLVNGFAQRSIEYVNGSRRLETHIWLNPNILRALPVRGAMYDPKKGLDFWTVDKSQASIFVHEFGHIVHYFLEYGPNSGKYALPFQSREQPTRMESLLELWTAAHRQQGNMVSKYGGSNRYENFAEGFVAWFLLPSRQWPGYSHELQKLLRLFLDKNNPYPYKNLADVRQLELLPEKEKQAAQKALDDLYSYLGIPKGTRLNPAEKALKDGVSMPDIRIKLSDGSIWWTEDPPLTAIKPSDLVYPEPNENEATNFLEAIGEQQEDDENTQDVKKMKASIEETVQRAMKRARK